MKFGTVVNCTDGRVQYPVMDYLKKHYDFDFFDAASVAPRAGGFSRGRNVKLCDNPFWSRRQSGVEVRGATFGYFGG